MNLLAEKLENKLHSIAQKYYADFSQIAVAVSGGADSLALIFLLNELKQKYPCSIKVLTVNHHLRLEADGEAKYVQNLMKSWGLEHYVLNWFPEDISTGIEEKARLARYQLMENWCVQNNIRYLMTAHHQQDQAETFLMRLQRGSGVDGLSAMSEFTKRGKIILIRPLLWAQPQELKQLLQKQGILWAEDASNSSDKFLRARIRKFLPELEQKTGISVRRLAETATALGEVREYLEMQTETFIHNRVRFFIGPAVSFSPLAFNQLALEIKKRVLVHLIKKVGGRDYPPEHKELINLLNNLRMENFAGCTLGGCVIEPFLKRWWIVRETAKKHSITHQEWNDFICRYSQFKKLSIPFTLKCLLFETMRK